MILICWVKLRSILYCFFFDSLSIFFDKFHGLLYEEIFEIPDRVISFFSGLFIKWDLINFQFNLFNVVSEFRFNYFQVESEQFVLDGFLNHSINDEPLQLGQFSRPSIDMFNDGEKYKPREWFINKFIEGEFWEYKSHFGLQLIIFNFFNGNLLLVQSLASFLFSLTIAILFIQLCRVHSFNFGLIFIASLVFNPWITPIARNSYFLVFIYLVPLVISYYFSRRINNSNFSLVIFLFILFILFLFKSLIGYDYLSTIVITSMIPINFSSI